MACYSICEAEKRGEDMSIHESGENYLETILVETRRRGRVRAVDVCAALGFSKPTVSIAMKKLREDGFVAADAEGFLELTEKGRQVAESIYERHNTIAALLMELGVSRETALADACKIEHDISDESFGLIKKHLEQSGSL